MSDPDLHARLRATLDELGALDRLPCSPGEHQAAERIAEELEALGVPVLIEQEKVHGSYITPIVLCCGAGALAGRAALRGGPRGVTAALAALATGLLWQDLSGGPRRWLRRRLPQAPTANVVGRIGPEDARRTIVIHAHHDAARTSPIFDQGLPTALWKRFPERMAGIDRYPPLMWLVLAGPAAAALGAASGLRALTRTGVTIATGTVGVMLHMRTQPVVPGANDNLTGVALLLELARRLQERPPPADVRIVLASVGAEESNQEGMLAFMARHQAVLPRDRTEFVCVDTVGSPRLILIEGEGFVRMRDYDEGLRDRLAAAADRAGVTLERGLRFTFATDALAPLRDGYATATLGSVNAAMLPSNYHWPTDTPENVDLDTLAGAVDVVEALVRDDARP